MYISKRTGQWLLLIWQGLWAYDREVLCNKVFNIAINLKSDGCQYGLASMVYEFFDKKNSGVSKLCQ